MHFDAQSICTIQKYYSNCEKRMRNRRPNRINGKNNVENASDERNNDSIDEKRTRGMQIASMYLAMAMRADRHTIVCSNFHIE